MIGAVRCLVRGQHQPVRHLLGGFRCTCCGAVGRDLAQMGFPEIGYVKPLRGDDTSESMAPQGRLQWRAGLSI